jgi:pimeloyl-ACP methyl ester carboxylesterase
MTIQVTLRKIFAVFLLIGCGSVFAQFQAEQQVSPLVARLGNGFISDYAKVNGTMLHYVRGGTGPAVILLHGFPQDWYEFHQIMPRLAEKFTVVAVDLRGMGGSTATPGGYDAANMAEDIHQLADQLHLEHVYVVGHDLGGMVAYAFARRYPETARGVMILDVPLAGIGPWEEIQTLPEVWHIRFHQTPDLPEKLIAGRQAIYFRHFLRARTSAMLTWLTTRNPTRLRKSCAPSSSSTALFRKTQSSTPPSAARPTCRFFWPPGNIRRSTDTLPVSPKPCESMGAQASRLRSFETAHTTWRMSNLRPWLNSSNGTRRDRSSDSEWQKPT